MSIKKIVRYGEPTLREPSKEVHKVSKKIQDWVKDLLDTMYSVNGVGLAAPQIGENVRVFVVDVSSANEPLNPLVFINPKIINSYEGCLSFPQAYTNVRRYEYIMIKALDRHGKSFVMEAKDGSLLARAIQHENDHLDGILFVDHARNRFETDEKLLSNNLNPIDMDYFLEEPELEEEISKEPEEKDE